jgi:tetratricopeptide (TPR) repeat protein
LALLLPLTLLTACASAGDRLNEGIALQAQGRYLEAVYRYAEAVERDRELIEAQDRLLAAGDSAVMIAMDNADDLERRGDPVRAAGQYRDIDRMVARIREVGMRLPLPSDYSMIRRAIFDNAINWQMVRGDEAFDEGRWAEARQYYIGARGDYLPSRDQVEESYDAETRVLLRWAEIELMDERPRSAHELAGEALTVRTSPSRETVLAVRDIQERALAAGTVVIAVAPVMADPGVREYLGGEFEIRLDNDLALDHWTRPPLFVALADPLILRTELRGLLRGQIAQSPLVVGRAVDLIGADLGVMIRLSGIEVIEEDVDTDRHEAFVPRSRSVGGRQLGRGRGVEQGRGRARGRGEQGEEEPLEEIVDTVTYSTHRGTMTYYVEADIILVDPSGREVTRFEASSTKSGPFTRGDFDGDPALLDLDDDEVPFFDPTVLADQLAFIEGAVLEELAVAIAAGTYDQVLRGVR